MRTGKISWDETARGRDTACSDQRRTESGNRIAGRLWHAQKS
jgi:hypothetical protein